MKHFYYFFAPMLLLLLGGANAAQAAKFIEPQIQGGSWDYTYSNEETKSKFSEFFSGAGTSANPYRINNANDLTRLAWCVKGGVSESSAGKHFMLTADIDLSAKPWGRIGHGANPFYGTFDGDGHTITGMKIGLNDGNRGLFGAINGATIKNLKIAASIVSCQLNGYNTGIIAGNVMGGDNYISNCHVSNDCGIIARNDVGGFVGYFADGNLSISRSSCAASVNLLGDCRAGGFVGGQLNGNLNLSDCIYTGAMIVDDGGNAAFGFMVGHSSKKSLTVNRCVGDGRYSISNFWKDISFLVGLTSVAPSVTDFYYVKDASTNNHGSITYIGEGPGAAAEYPAYKLAANAVHLQSMADTLNTKAGKTYWGMYNGKLTPRTFKLTTTGATQVNDVATSTGTVSQHVPYKFTVQLPVNPNLLYYPAIASGSVTASSDNQYVAAYLGNGKYELTTGDEYVTLTAATIAYPAPGSMSATFDQWEKKVTVNVSKASGVSARPGKWYLYRKEGGNNTDASGWTRSEMGTASTFSYTYSVEYDKNIQYGARFVVDGDAVPAAPAADGYGSGSWVKAVKTTPEATVNNLKTENGATSVKLSFTIDRRLNSTRTNDKYSIWRKKNNGEYARIFGPESFKGAGSGTGELSYEYTDNTDMGSSCDRHTYKVELSALEGHDFTSGEVIGQVTNAAKLANTNATKGEYSSYVRVSWATIDKVNPSDVGRYKVWRRVTDNATSAWSELATINTSDNEYIYTDDKALPGVYYDYRVELLQECAGVYKPMSEQSSIGFAQSLGTASGRITYGTGTAVEGVSVLVKRSELDGETAQYASLRATGGGQTMDWEADSSYLNGILAGDFTCQLYLRPNLGMTSTDDNKIWFASIGNGNGNGDGHANTIWLALEPDGNGYKILSSSGTGVTKDFTTSFTIPANKFSHLTLVRSSARLTLYAVNDDNPDSVVLQSATRSDAYATTSFSKPSIRMGYDLKGNLDEVRFWGRALGEAEILRDYNRILTGSESELKAYWTFDEPVSGYIFDVSRTGKVFNNNHGTRTLPSDTENIPNDTQLALKGVTDADGNYQIRGISFSGEGTSYDVVPLMGVHQFQPSKQLRYVSNQSLVHNATDFTDISSFKVSGQITYAGSDYPVEGAQLYVDGMPANRDGQALTSNGEGKFEIDVPIGEHFITVSKMSHVFANEGRYPAQLKHNFQNNITGLTFTDNTLVRIVGRVAGGNIETNRPLGFGLSKANIGKATVTIETRNDSYQLNLTNSDVQKTFTLPAAYGLGAGNSSAREQENRATFKSTVRGSRIEVETNPVTGEFVVELPPVPYNITRVTTKKHDSSLETFRFDKQTLDVQPTRIDTLSYTDTAGNAYRVFAHDTLRIAYYSEPVFEVKDLGNPHGAFGDSTYAYSDAARSDTLSLYRVKDDGSIYYAAGYPVFSQKKNTYRWEISAFERYQNSDGGDTVVDFVPLSGQEIYIDNALASLSIEIDTIRDTSMLTSSQSATTLDENGKMIYTFNVGFPNLAGDNLLSAKFSFTQNGKEIVWNNGAADGELFKGYLLGQVPSGGNNNFTTVGPDNVDIVLHDPPGSNSYAYIEKGSSVTHVTATSALNETSEMESVTAHIGGVVVSGTGVGFMIMSKLEDKGAISETFESTQTFGENNETTTTTTFNQRVATSSDPAFVGVNADVYIGRSTNFLYGKMRQLAFYPQNQYDGNDQPVEVDNFKLFTKEVIAVGQEFGTMFSYTQDHILNNLIPNTKAIRNAQITTISSLSDTLNVSFDDGLGGTKKAVYLSLLPAGDPMFGEPETYYIFYPADATDMEKVKDDVAMYNKWIKSWEQRIADNEKAMLDLFGKREELDAMRNPNIFENVSFDGGVSIEKSQEVSYEELKTTVDNYNVGGAIHVTSGFGWNKFGFEIHGELGYNRTNESSTGDGGGNSCVFGYELSEDAGDALTVDVYAPSNDNMKRISSLSNVHGYIFQTRAGQTSCPYEGEVKTLFYKEDGEAKTLSGGTFQIEKPEIYIDNTKNATAENIPSGREATFTLQLQNLSDANLPVTYQLSVGDNANRNGLILSIDGTPLTSPREYAIEYGEELVKTLKVRQSSVDILEYSGVTLLLSSTCDDNISSQAAIGVKYIPSSTDLKLVALNTLANVAEGASVGFRIAEYDRSFRNFAAIRLQYKNVNDHTWVTLREFINDTSLIPIAGNGQELIRSASITYTCDLQSLVDGEYDFRAISVALLGNDEVTASSEEIRIIKDMKAPQLLGNASPANGILTPESEISVLFNENIRSAYVKDGNISVKAILNGHKVAHATALKLSGGAPASTEAGIPLANRSFSLEAWFERALGQPGTLLAHGGDFSLGFTADDKVTVAIGGETFTSVDALTESGWQYIGFAYNSDGQAFSVYLLAGSETKTLFTAKPVAAPYAGSGRLLVGANADGTAAFTGAVHNLSLWNSNRLLSDLSDKDQAKTGAEKSLAGYWPLTEGHGAVAADKARSRHLSLPNANSWYLRNVNKAVAFDGSSYLALSAAHIPVTGDENFAVEFWFRGAAQAGAATLFSCGDGVLDSAPAQNLSAGFDAAGKLTLRANGESYLLSPESYLDNSWRHFALNVLRSGSAIAYVDGAAVKQLPASAIGQMAAESIVLGARRYRNKAYTALSDLYTTDSYFTGELDEIRIWKSARTADAIRQDIYNRLNGNEAGLQAYYPFEATYTDEYNQLVTSGTLEDCLNQPSATGLTPAGAATSVGSVTFSDQAPALKEARALENVAHTWTASNNKIVVNIVEPAYRIENTTLELTVSGILDLNDNPLAQPIAWTAYANMNRLRWSDDELAVSKEYLDEATREVAILNESGLEETWTLSGLPSWLTVSKTSGSIKPLSSEKLTFTVSASTPTGAYEEIIYLTGGSQIDAPLPVSLKVSAQTPDWGVSAADFEHSMSLIAQLTFEGGAPSKNPEDIVAAFIDGVCVGRASPAYYSRYDAGFVIFDIYGSSDMSAKTVTFKAWDAGAGRIYPAVTPSTPVTFVSNKLAGSMSSPVTLNGENKVEQQTLLAKGWSWVSLSVRPADLSVGNAFASVKASVAMLKSKSAFSVPNGAAWAGDLQAVEIGKMYKVRLTEQRTLTLTGEEINPQQAPVTIKPQWSWIGYAPQLSLPLEDALADLSPSEGDLIKGQSRFATYTGGAWIGSLATLAPGKGYLYYSTAAADKQFRFPSAAAATPASPAAYTARSLTASRLAAPAATQWTAVSETKYAGNMTIIAVVKSGSRTLTSGEVGVFAGSECRAAQSCAPDGSGLLFITVAGDDPVQLTFKVYDQAAGATYSVQQTLTFGDDAAHGTISDPYVIQIRLEEEEATGIDRLSAAGVKVYPTVVSDVLHVESESVALHSISVYNVNGSLVRQLSAEGSLTATLSLASLPQGAYFVIVETKEGKTLTVQIIR